MMRLRQINQRIKKLKCILKRKNRIKEKFDVNGVVYRMLNDECVRIKHEISSLESLK